MSKKIESIVLIMAMQDEAGPIIDALSLSETREIIDPMLPMRCFQGDFNGLQISLVLSGIDKRFSTESGIVENIGSEAATLMAYEAVTKLEPSLIISAGTAGGFAKKGAKIGTVYLSKTHFVYHDRHVPLPGFDRSAIGEYPAAAAESLARFLNIEQGIISTGSSLKKSSGDIEVIESYNAVAKDMEAAAIAWVAELFSTPVIALKSITNLVDEDNVSEEEFVKNLYYASNCLKEKLLSLIAYLPEKSISDLAGE